MAGIDDLVKVYRGEELLPKLKNILTKSDLRAKTGRFATTLADYASGHARKFPNVIKSTKISPKELNIGKKLFNRAHFVQTMQPDSFGQLQILSKKNASKLKVDALKTFMSNAKALTPLATKGLAFISSLPVSTLIMTLQSTPANADEANMQLEDFAKLAEANNMTMGSNMDKALPGGNKDI